MLDSYDDLEPGDLILSYEKTIASWIVRKFTKSQWSHVGLYDEKGKFISAVPLKGVCSKRLTQVTHSAVYRVKGLTDQERLRVVGFCMKRAGKPYDLTQIFILAWRIITDTLATNDGDPNPDEYICSELVAEAYASIGVYFGRIVDNVLPGTIAESTQTIRIR